MFARQKKRNRPAACLKASASAVGFLNMLIDWSILDLLKGTRENNIKFRLLLCSWIKQSNASN